MAEKKRKKTSSKRILIWIAAIIIFYVLTSATVSTGIVEITKKVPQNYVAGTEQIVTEKLVKTTKYRTEKVPYGTPRCEQFVYNFSKIYTYSENVVNNQKIATCTYLVKNEEDISGIFNFYPNLLKTGKISDGATIKKNISAFGTARFEWNFTLENTETASCLLRCGVCPTRMKCFYLEPITYQVKEVPYVVEEKKNVTEYSDIIKTRTVTQKANETRNIYTNRFFGYKQFLYLGY